VDAARYSYQDTRDLVVLVCGNLYLRALAEDSRIAAARAQLETARALHRVAADRKEAGMVPAVDVLRADVFEQERLQRVIVAENRAARAKLDLARAIGLPLGQEFRLADAMPQDAAPQVRLEEALAQAYASRADWKRAQARVREAEASRRSALGEGLPKIDVSADYGAIGQSLSGARATYTLGAALHVPLFEGGKVIGKVIEADATLQAERARLEDLRGRIDYDVRTAFLDLRAASERVSVAAHAAQVAQLQLRQAEDRFEAGVASNIDVVQAQQAAVESAENDIAAAYDRNVARASLARALGVAESAFKQLVRGE
jgi:outer membrane protein TolC